MKNIKIGQRYFDPEDYTIYFVLLLNEENNFNRRRSSTIYKTCTHAIRVAKTF